MRRLLAACAAAGLALLLVVAPGVSPAAQAAVVAPGVPNPVNILPSVAVATKTVLTSPEALAVMMLQWMKDPRFWNAAKAVQAGTPSAAEVATVAEEAASFAAPATKTAVLTKVAGGASVVLAAGQVGLMMGNGAARLFGFKDDQVCAEQNGVLTAISAITNGVDCTTFNNQLAESIRNLDQQQVQTQASACSVYGDCGQYLGFAPYTGTPGGPWIQYCFKFKTAPSAAAVAAGAYGGARLGYQVNGVDAGQARDVYGTNYCLQKFPGTTDLMVDYWKPVGTLLSGLRVFYLTQSSQVIGQGSYTFKPEDTTRPNPTRGWRCTTTTVNGQVYAHDSTAWTETDPVFGTPVCPTVPPTEVPARTVIEQTTPGAPAAPVFDQPTTPEYQGWRTAYPECGTGTCMLDLKKADTSCFASPVPCSDWFADPNKAEDYNCVYGTHAVALTECNLYAPTFKPDATSTGNVYADPETGQDVGVQTGVGSSLAPGTSVDDPEQSRECFPTGWAVFNPVEWVLKPVGCALQWAFVPRTSAVDDATEGTKEAWESSTPGKLAQALLVFNFAAPSAGCQGLAVPIPTPDSAGHVQLVNRYFLPACPGDFFAPWAPLFSVFIGGAACITGFFGAARHLGGIFGYGSLGGDS